MLNDNYILGKKAGSEGHCHLSRALLIVPFVVCVHTVSLHQTGSKHASNHNDRWARAEVS